MNWIEGKWDGEEANVEEIQKHEFVWVYLKGAPHYECLRPMVSQGADFFLSTARYASENRASLRFWWAPLESPVRVAPPNYDAVRHDSDGAEPFEENRWS